LRNKAKKLFVFSSWLDYRASRAGPTTQTEEAEPRQGELRPNPKVTYWAFGLAGTGFEHRAYFSTTPVPSTSLRVRSTPGTANVSFLPLGQ
jgi:hypothetical protein